jgi:glutamate---cysteine ligase / carboxylate-amine ligase
MEKKSRLHLFEAYGVELEYMIVDQKNLDVRPFADVLLRNEDNEVEGELEFGDVAWSNELVSHVIEIKSNGPNPDLEGIAKSFHKNILEINKRLEGVGAKLMPGATHPWMSPAKDTKLWEHDSREIYEAFDRFFNCKGHGWSNLQSTHINLPFYDDQEFSKLHTAIRLILPIIPALTASSPIMGGKSTGFCDRRLFYYETNQASIPILTGKVIPERIYTKHGYQKYIYDKIAAAIKPHDPDGIFNPIWLNSRGAMARFDRGAIEIRIIDIQECPTADLAIVALIVHLLKLIVKGEWISFDAQKSFETTELQQIFKDCIKTGSKTVIENERYMQTLGFEKGMKVGEVWKTLIEKVSFEFPSEMKSWKNTLVSITAKGTLAERLLSAVGEDYSHDHLHAVYNQLSDCLQNDCLFDA